MTNSWFHLFSLLIFCFQFYWYNFIVIKNIWDSLWYFQWPADAWCFWNYLGMKNIWGVGDGVCLESLRIGCIHFIYPFLYNGEICRGNDIPFLSSKFSMQNLLKIYYHILIGNIVYLFHFKLFFSLQTMFCIIRIANPVMLRF